LILGELKAYLHRFTPRIIFYAAIAWKALCNTGRVAWI